MQVQFWIHWQALILFLKKATVFEVDHPKYNFHGSTNLQCVPVHCRAWFVGCMWLLCG